jgi:F0F1-type ATP synthase membrane subunit b/b'
MAAGMAWAAEEGDKPEDGKLETWKIANFALLAIGLGYMIAKNLPPFFRTRTTEIQQGIAEAQQIKRDAEKRAAATDAKVAALGQEIEKFRTESREEMQRESERISRETARQIARLQQQAQLDIESAAKTARRELRNYAAGLSIELAEQRIRGRLDATSESAILDWFVADLKREGSNN